MTRISVRDRVAFGMGVLDEDARTGGRNAAANGSPTEHDSLREQSSLPRQKHRFVSVLGAELVVDLAQMPFHGIAGKGQLLGNGQVRVTLRQALQNLQLALRDRLDC